MNQTIVERLCMTKNLAARHLLQDEAARLGAQGMISGQLEARLVLAETSDVLNDAPRDLVREHFESSRIQEREKDALAAERKSLRLPESDPAKVQWLRGVAVPSEEFSERSLQPLLNE